VQAVGCRLSQEWCVAGSAVKHECLDSLFGCQIFAISSLNMLLISVCSLY
jgi:hypothetical protein